MQARPLRPISLQPRPWTDPNATHQHRPHRSPSFPQLQHDIRDLDILLRLVLGRHLEDDVFLVRGNGPLADGFDKLAEPT